MRTPRNEPLGPDIADEDAGPHRTCIVSRRVAPKDALIRLALGPDGTIAPDVRAKAPGRGAWIGVTRADLDAAAGPKGKLKGALARAFKQEVTVPDDLSGKIAAALRQAALDRLGLEARAGTLVNGADRVEQAARLGKVHLLLHAADAGADGRRKLDQALRVGARDAGRADADGLRGLVFPEGRTILSVALGRENVVHAALTDPAAARRVRHAIDRWLAFLDAKVGLDGDTAVGTTGDTTDVDEGQK